MGVGRRLAGRFSSKPTQTLSHIIVADGERIVSVHEKKRLAGSHQPCDGRFLRKQRWLQHTAGLPCPEPQDMYHEVPDAIGLFVHINEAFSAVMRLCRRITLLVSH